MAQCGMIYLFLLSLDNHRLKMNVFSDNANSCIGNTENPRAAVTDEYYAMDVEFPIRPNPTLTAIDPAADSSKGLICNGMMLPIITIHFMTLFC